MTTQPEHERIDFDVLFIGGGPANLAGAIRLMQMARERNLDLEVALIEKGAEVGSHALSGAVLNPRALEELIPDYSQTDCPIENTVRADELCYLTAGRKISLPYIPSYMHNEGFPIVSLARLCRWLAATAEELGVNIFPGFAGTEVLYAPDRKTVVGVRTGDKGFDKDGSPKGNFEAGIDLMAKVTVFGEGARGSLFKTLASRLAVFDARMPMVFETGIKEVIQLPEGHYFTSSRSNCLHFMGYPLGLKTPGGGFVYEMQDNRISLGFLVGLGYEDPGLDPYERFIRFKRHPFVADIIRGGKVIEQGARTVSTGGYYTIPRLAVDGAVFVGGSAGIQNTPALKGIHVSMKSGMLAAEAIVEACAADDFGADSLMLYQRLFEASWVQSELRLGRNTFQALSKGGLGKFFHLGAQYVTGGRGVQDPMPIGEDHHSLKASPGLVAGDLPEANLGELDGDLYVDKLTGVYLSKTVHREDQPSHIVVHDTRLCIDRCLPTYGAPCTRFCPGSVYEIESDDHGAAPRLKLNPTNCLHCKTCDIKDPFENITWNCPEGGEGPGYTVV